MISFGVCAYNEEKSITKAIASILPQMDKNDELIVVASGCTDKTVETVKSLKDPRIKIIKQQKRSGKGAATNTLLTHIKGNILIYFDADIIVGKQAVSYLLSHFRSSKTGAVSARIVPYQVRTFFDKVVSFSRNALHLEKLKEQKKGIFWSLNGYLFALRKGIVKNIDPANLVEDALLGFLVRQKGYEVVYEPKAIVYEKAPQSLPDYINQKTRVRLGWLQMINKYSMEFCEKRNITHFQYLLKDRFAWPYLLLEIIIWTKAKIDFRSGRFHWPHVASSKI